MEQSPQNAGFAVGIGAVTFIVGAWMLAGSASGLEVFDEGSNGLFYISLVLLVISALAMLVGGMLVAERVPSFMRLHHVIIRGASVIAAFGALIMTVGWAMLSNLHVDSFEGLGEIGADIAAYQAIVSEVIHHTGMGLTIASLGFAGLAFQTAVNAQGLMRGIVHWPVLVGAIWSVVIGTLFFAQILEPSWFLIIPTILAGAVFTYAVGSAEWSREPGETHY